MFFCWEQLTSGYYWAAIMDNLSVYLVMVVAVSLMTVFLLAPPFSVLRRQPHQGGPAESVSPAAAPPLSRSDLSMRKKLLVEMSESEKVEEQRVQHEQLEKIFSLMAENEEAFGRVTFQDVKNQLSMYQ